MSKVILQREYYERTTDRVSFLTHDVLRYDLDTDTYYVVDRLSPALEKYMRSVMSPEIRAEYDRFIWDNWGARGKNVPGTEEDSIDEVARAIAEMPDEPEVKESAFDGVDTSNMSVSDLMEPVGSIVPVVDDFSAMFDFFGESGSEEE